MRAHSSHLTIKVIHILSGVNWCLLVWIVVAQVCLAACVWLCWATQPKNSFYDLDKNIFSPQKIHRNCYQFRPYEIGFQYDEIEYVACSTLCDS